MSQFLLGLWSKRLPIASLSTGGLVLFLGGCAPVVSNLPAPLRALIPLSEPPVATLQFQVTPTDQPGVYAVSGSSDFPDNSEIRIAAIRYLRPPQDPVLALLSKATYSVLSYQTTIINQGKWQAKLNLWQVAKDGQFKESWQLHQPELKLAAQPAPDVIFLATLAPDQADPVKQLEQQLKAVGKRVNGDWITATVNGERYIRVAQRLEIALPTGSTTPPPVKPSDINGGWGNRFLMPEEPPIPYTLEFPQNRRTDAPAAPQEFLR